MPLLLNGVFLTAEVDNRTVRVAKLSKACTAELEELAKKGFVPCGANVRFIVAWKGEDDIDETAVMLPDLHLIKNSHNSN